MRQAPHRQSDKSAAWRQWQLYTGMNRVQANHWRGGKWAGLTHEAVRHFCGSRWDQEEAAGGSAAGWTDPQVSPEETSGHCLIFIVLVAVRSILGHPGWRLRSNLHYSFFPFPSCPRPWINILVSVWTWSKRIPNYVRLPDRPERPGTPLPASAAVPPLRPVSVCVAAAEPVSEGEPEGNRMSTPHIYWPFSHCMSTPHIYWPFSHCMSTPHIYWPFSHYMSTPHIYWPFSHCLRLGQRFWLRNSGVRCAQPYGYTQAGPDSTQSTPIATTENSALFQFSPQSHTVYWGGGGGGGSLHTHTRVISSFLAQRLRRQPAVWLRGPQSCHMSWLWPTGPVPSRP